MSFFDRGFQIYIWKSLFFLLQDKEKEINMANIQKEIAGRLILKHDIESNWNRATTFIPKQGEIIVYDIDDNYSYERFKLGDGKTTAIALPFYLENELEIILNKIDYLADNTLDANWQDGILHLTKGINFLNL